MPSILIRITVKAAAGINDRVQELLDELSDKVKEKEEYITQWHAYHTDSERGDGQYLVHFKFVYRMVFFMPD
jgi:hypothetical protein